MRLKNLELNGFKSFSKKTILEFKNSLVCIVGPNGSGKSNVVEAFRYVLGEQSMKSLRGKTGTDLIFKGSKSVPAGSRATATIYFDNSDKVFKLSNDCTIFAPLIGWSRSSRYSSPVNLVGFFRISSGIPILAVSFNSVA